MHDVHKVGRDADLRVIEDPEARFIAVFENTVMVLAAAGASFDDLIEFTGHFTRLQRDFPLFRTVKDRYVTCDLPVQTARRRRTVVARAAGRAGMYGGGPGLG